MKITAEYLDKKWGEINYYNGGYLRLDAEHPLDWYVGYKDIDKKTLLLVSHIDMGTLPSSKSILVTHGKRDVDGNWTLSFDLMRKEQESVFSILCSDILVYSQLATSEHNALVLVSKRFKQWNKLLEHQGKSIMDEGSRKGLIGEVLFLISLVEGGMDVARAILGWVGPDEADQDFVYSDKWYEIKSVGISAERVSISSLEQLNNVDYGDLVIMRIDKCAPEKPGALSLMGAVNKAISLSEQYSDSKELLEQKLYKYGYIDLPEYDEQKYFYSGSHHYLVNESFPKLISTNVPAEVLSVQYAISLSSIEPWKI